MLGPWQTEEIHSLAPEKKEMLPSCSPEDQKKLFNSKPWSKNPEYFHTVHISTLAAFKMAIHADEGGNIEVMGVLQGRISEESFIVDDAIALPVIGTETRVNAQAEGNEYLVEHLRLMKLVNKSENIVGWYHSHPGYGCWLSGIDVNTQMLNQQYQDPFVALVIDPFKTIANGAVEIGGFRTFPKGFVSKDFEGVKSNNLIPNDKLEEFGVHSKKYYSLNIKYFAFDNEISILEAIEGNQWSSKLKENTGNVKWDKITEQTSELAAKMEIYSKKLKKEIKSSKSSTKLPDPSAELVNLASKELVSLLLKDNTF